jgi:hypothetical protein
MKMNEAGYVITNKCPSPAAITGPHFMAIIFSERRFDFDSFCNQKVTRCKS